MKTSKGWAHLIGLGVLLLAASATTSAQTTYRWDDADGQTHYSDQPPPTGALNVKVIRDSGFDSDDGTTSGGDSSYLEQEAAFQERQAKRAEQQAREEEAKLAAAQRKKNCEMARSNYNTISVGGRVTRVNAQGEREFLSDEEIEKETIQARKAMDEACKK